MGKAGSGRANANALGARRERQRALQNFMIMDEERRDGRISSVRILDLYCVKEPNI
jgi:hypothetical protein